MWKGSVCPFFCCFARSHLGACLEIRANVKCENNAKTAFFGGSQIWVNVCIWMCFKIRGPKWIQMAKMFVYFLRSRTIHLWRTSCSSLRLKHHPFAKLPKIASCKSRYTVHSITELSWMVHSYPFEKCGVSWDSQLLCFLSGRHWQGEFPCPSLARFVMCNLRQQLQLQVRQKKMRCQS